jgi:hypothetical protein
VKEQGAEARQAIILTTSSPADVFSLCDIGPRRI